jgi:hypothetical protein
MPQPTNTNLTPAKPTEIVSDEQLDCVVGGVDVQIQHVDTSLSSAGGEGGLSLSTLQSLVRNVIARITPKG